MKEDFQLVTADICPHGGSSSLCEWCGYKASLVHRDARIAALERDLEAARAEREYAANIMGEEIVVSMRLRTQLAASQAAVRRMAEALRNVRDEQIMAGEPLRPMRELENVLVSSMRNIAHGALAHPDVVAAMKDLGVEG